MSREERRAYQRQMKGMERGAALPPGAKERADRNAARRAQRRAKAGDVTPGAFTPRFWIRPVLVAVAIGVIAFSLQWSEGMPRALYVGLGAGAVMLLVLVGFRFLQRRAAPRT